jgi:hypothetical protein
LIAAWIWYGPGGCGAGTGGRGLALGDQVGSQRRGPGRQPDQLAGGGGAGGRRDVDQQHQREQAEHLRLVGHQLGQQPPSRIASRTGRADQASPELAA